MPCIVPEGEMGFHEPMPIARPKHPDKRKECSFKRSFRSKREARNAAARAKKHNGHILYTYRCRFGNHYHLTRRKQVET